MQRSIPAKLESGFSISGRIKETLYHSFEHPYIVVDHLFEIKEISGDVSQFAADNSFFKVSENVLNVVHHLLHASVRMLIEDLKNGKHESKTKILRVEFDDKTLWLRIATKALIRAEDQPALYLIIFEELETENSLSGQPSDLSDYLKYHYLLQKRNPDLQSLNANLKAIETDIYAENLLENSDLWGNIGKFCDADSKEKIKKLLNEAHLSKKLAEESQVFLKDILDSISDGYVSLDKDWICTFANEKGALLVGKKTEELVGKRIWDLFPEGIDQPFYLNYEKVMKDKIPVVLTEYFAPWDRWYENRIYPLKDGISIFFSDLTQRKKSEILLKELNEKLEKRAAELASSNAELEQFAYVASHDLQEPLRMVNSFLQLLNKKYSGQLDEQAEKYIHFAVDGAQRMNQLILDLLEYSRVGLNRDTFKAVDMNDIVARSLTIFKERIEEDEATVIVEQLPVIRANKMQMEQLIQNLIGNALKYRSEYKPELHFEVKEEDKYWKFSLKDNGIGIDPRFFRKIFTIFQRLHNKKEYSGTGVGLAICNKIIEKHGGKMWVESEAGAGSKFFFTISRHLE